MFTILGVSTSARLARMAQEAQALPHGDAALEQKGPDLVDDGGALTD